MVLCVEEYFLLTLVFHANRIRIVNLFFVPTCFVDQVWVYLLFGICRRTMFFVTFFGLLIGDYDVKGVFVKLT
jgi:hypothetical protein